MTPTNDATCPPPFTTEYRTGAAPLRAPLILPAIDVVAVDDGVPVGGGGGMVVVIVTIDRGGSSGAAADVTTAGVVIVGWMIGTELVEVVVRSWSVVEEVVVLGTVVCETMGVVDVVEAAGVVDVVDATEVVTGVVWGGADVVTGAAAAAFT